MRMLCPHCGRPGNLPDKLRSGAHRVKCRKCKARFTAVAYAQLESEPGTEEMPALLRFGAEASAGDRSAHLADHPIDGFEDFDSSEIELRPGDSQYQISSNFQGFADDDSQIELPAFSATESESRRMRLATGASDSAAERGAWDLDSGQEPNRIRALGHDDSPRLAGREETRVLQPSRAAGALAAQSMPPAVGRTSPFVRIWSRYQLAATLAFGAGALGLLGFFLVRSSIAGKTLSPATAALVVGLLGTVAFVLLSLTAIVLSALLVELSRDLHRFKPVTRQVARTK